MTNIQTAEMIQITFRPDDRVAETTCGQRLIDVARGVGVGIVADCGGKGRCGKCRVRFESDSVPSDALSKPLPQEKKLLPEDTNGRFFRLACRTRVYKDATVTVPAESRTADDSLRKPATAYAISIRPAVSRITFAPDPQNESAAAQPFMKRVKVALSKSIDREAKGPSLSVKAAIETVDILREGAATGRVNIDKKEEPYLDRIESTLKDLPEDEYSFIDDMMDEVDEDKFVPAEYDIACVGVE